MAKKKARQEMPSPGEQIRRIRGELGLSQIQLAEKLETSQSAVARLESPDYDGHSLHSLRRAAEALDRRLIVRFVTDEEYEAEIEGLPETPEEQEKPRRGRPRKSDAE